MTAVLPLMLLPPFRVTVPLLSMPPPLLPVAVLPLMLLVPFRVTVPRLSMRH